MNACMGGRKKMVTSPFNNSQITLTLSLFRIVTATKLPCSSKLTATVTKAAGDRTNALLHNACEHSLLLRCECFTTKQVPVSQCADNDSSASANIPGTHCCRNYCVSARTRPPGPLQTALTVLLLSTSQNAAKSRARGDRCATTDRPPVRLD